MLHIDLDEPLQISNPKINTNFDRIENEKQNKISATGILKGYGTGAIAAAAAGVDYMAANAITSGSNANGSWLKFPDGTLVQWRTDLVDLGDSNAVYLPLPMEVYDAKQTAAIATSTSYHGSTDSVGCHVASNNTQIAIYFSRGGVAITNTKVGYNYIVIGRWKA